MEETTRFKEDDQLREGRTIETRRLVIYPATQKHLGFLLRLWNDPEIMRYAGFARNWDHGQIREWYGRYRNRVAKYGSTEVQFVFRLRSGMLVGECGLGRVRSGWECRDYRVPPGQIVVMTDIKLKKLFWHKGYGTEAMKAITRYVFTNTCADLLLVPPHRDNARAIRLYEKAGFGKTEGIYYRYHIIYQMTRDRFNATREG
jgi:RimJ/RimL family protein N-acetyltransferase